jgi:hypothetical protein
LFQFNLFYLLLFLFWSFIGTGYLRYGLILEFLGGLLLLLFFSDFYLHNEKNWFINLILIYIFFLILILNFRIIKSSIKYDLSWRWENFLNGYQKKYLSEIKNINFNKIKVDEKIIKDYNPQIYLNCASSNLGYYVVSPFNYLPVFNINKNFYSSLTLNKNYMDEQVKRLKKYVKTNNQTFVTIVVTEGLDENINMCLKNLEERKYKIKKIINTDFLGYKRQKLAIIFGEINNFSY